MTPTAIYRAIMVCVEERRQQLGLAMWQVDELAGTHSGYYAKAVHADAPSGRQSTWPILQMIVQALWPQGFVVKIADAPAQVIADAPAFKSKLLHITARYDRKARSKLMAELGKRGREIQLHFYDEKTRTRIGRKAWRNRRKRQRRERANRSPAKPAESRDAAACRGALRP